MGNVPPPPPHEFHLQWAVKTSKYVFVAKIAVIYQVSLTNYRGKR